MQTAGSSLEEEPIGHSPSCLDLIILCLITQTNLIVYSLGKFEQQVQLAKRSLFDALLVLPELFKCHSSGALRISMDRLKLSNFSNRYASQRHVHKSLLLRLLVKILLCGHVIPTTMIISGEGWAIIKKSSSGAAHVTITWSKFRATVIAFGQPVQILEKSLLETLPQVLNFISALMDGLQSSNPNSRYTSLGGIHTAVFPRCW